MERDEDRQMEEWGAVVQNPIALIGRGESVMALPTPSPQLPSTPAPSTTLFC